MCITHFQAQIAMDSSATQFKAGRSGNPRGRKPTMLMSTISASLRKSARTQLAGRSDEIVRLAIERAASGDGACIAAVIGLMSAVIEPTKKPGNVPAKNSQ